MANNYDFSNLKRVKIQKINIDGWVNPITIEYGQNLYNTQPSYYWRVKGTEHTFIILIKQLDILSKGNYAKHFEEVLKKFRSDYQEWSEEYNFEAEWMQEYKRQFNKFITL